MNQQEFIAEHGIPNDGSWPWADNGDTFNFGPFGPKDFEPTNPAWYHAMNYWDYDYHRHYEPFGMPNPRISLSPPPPEPEPEPFWNPAFPPSTKADGFPGYSTDPIVLLNPHPLAVLDAVRTSLDSLSEAEYNAIINRFRQAIRHSP